MQSDASSPGGAAAELPLDQEALYQRICEEAAETADSAALYDVTVRVVGDLLRRDADTEHRDKTFRLIEQYFGLLQSNAQAKPLLQDFALKAIRMIIVQRPKLAQAYALQQTTTTGRRTTDLPWHLRPLGPTSIVLVEPPPPQCFDTFDEVFAAGICRRVALITTFFQRHNADVKRELVPPFIQTADFATRLEQVIRKYIVPFMRNSRAIRLLEAKYPWPSIDSREEWNIIERDQHKDKDKVLILWQAAWDTFRQTPVSKLDPVTKVQKTVLRANAELKEIRDILASDAYALPRITNLELDFFKTFLNPEYDRMALENAWTRLRQLYEQEMDRRVYQDKAREGAFRDSLLVCFDTFPDRTAEFLALLGYFNFPKLGLSFLENFTRNKGSNVAERDRKIPFLMWYLRQEQIEEVNLIEIRRASDEMERIKIEKQKLLDAERETMNGVGTVAWQRN